MLKNTSLKKKKVENTEMGTLPFIERFKGKIRHIPKDGPLKTIILPEIESLRLSREMRLL